MAAAPTLRRGLWQPTPSWRASGMLRQCATITPVDSGSLWRFTSVRSVRLSEDTSPTICWRSRELSDSGMRRGTTTYSTGVNVSLLCHNVSLLCHNVSLLCHNMSPVVLVSLLCHNMSQLFECVASVQLYH